MFHNVYFDESYTGDGSLFVLSGYIFEKSQAEIFSTEWGAYLATLGLSYAHQVDCVHRANEYKKLTKAKCDECARTLIEQIKKRTLGSVSVGVNLNTYNSIMEPEPSLGRMTAYTFLLMLCVEKVRQMLSPYNSKISYVFEAGHPSEPEAARYMTALSQSPLKGNFPVEYFGFSTKQDSPPLQAADMLAWQHRKYLLDVSAGKRSLDKPRADFRAMTRISDIHTMVDKASIQAARMNLGLLTRK